MVAAPYTSLGFPRFSYPNSLLRRRRRTFRRKRLLVRRWIVFLPRLLRFCLFATFSRRAIMLLERLTRVWEGVLPFLTSGTALSRRLRLELCWQGALPSFLFFPPLL